MDWSAFNTTTDSLDKKLLQFTYKTATHSTDPNTHVGAVLVRLQERKAP